MLNKPNYCRYVCAGDEGLTFFWLPNTHACVKLNMHVCAYFRAFFHAYNRITSSGDESVQRECFLLTISKYLSILSDWIFLIMLSCTNIMYFFLYTAHCCFKRPLSWNYIWVIRALKSLFGKLLTGILTDRYFKSWSKNG